MEERKALCGRDAVISVDGKKLLQAEKAELRAVKEIHRVRSCFQSEDAAHAQGKRTYKLNLTGVRFRSPFENCNFYDMDNFTTELEIDGEKIILEGCMWDELSALADREKLREHISITALRLGKEG